jgi:hypothetical protein
VPDFDTSVPHIARVYDYWLGGKDNYAVDRELGERTIAAYPGIVLSVRANRAFLGRAVRFLVTECGIRQFLDIGTGIPTSNNTHEVAQRHEPASRIVYVDNDPVVLLHAKALMHSSEEGACAYIDADMHDHERILVAAAETLDFSKPVAVMFMAVLHLATDATEASTIVGNIMTACVPGSYLAISHPASDIDTDQVAELTRVANESMAQKITPRDQATVTGFFNGFDLVEPGLIRAARWRPDSELDAYGTDTLWAGVARKH